MNQFGIIIQETTAGSNQQFVSAHLDINSLEIKETITDERTLASQLANLSDVYSVQFTKNYKVYSLIVTNLTDFLGRSGYYAIRLYAPKGVNLTNFESILATIKEKYNNYTKSSTLNNQNYEDILSSILIVENDRKNFVAVKSTINCFYYFDDANSTLSSVFNTKGVNLVHKIYAFNKNKAVNESIALTTGLKSFSQINTSQKEINVINNYGILNELKINDQLVNFNQNDTKFIVLCQTTDRVSYNVKDDKTYKTIINNSIVIEKKFVPRLQSQNTYSGANNRKKKNNSNAMYLIVGLMALLIGGGMFYFFNQDDNTSSNDHTKINSTSNGQPNAVRKQNDTNSNKIKLEQKPYKESKTDYEYTTKFSKLSNYKFVFAGGKWSIIYLNKKDKEGNLKIGDFYIKNLDDFTLNGDEKILFINELEKISHQQIFEAEIKKDAKSENESTVTKSFAISDAKKKADKKKVILNAKKAAEKKAAERKPANEELHN